jgi:hypothetical protein
MATTGVSEDWNFSIEDVNEYEDLDPDKQADDVIDSFTGQRDFDVPDDNVNYQENCFRTILEDSKFLGAIIRSHKRRTYRFKQKKPRYLKLRRDCWESNWGQLLRDPRVKVKGSTQYKDFRRMFRLPFELFGPFVDECRERQIFVTDYAKESGRKPRDSYIPIEFKVLLSLRVLGRDWCFHDIKDSLSIGEETAP